MKIHLCWFIGDLLLHTSRFINNLGHNMGGKEDELDLQINMLGWSIDVEPNLNLNTHADYYVERKPGKMIIDREDSRLIRTNSLDKHIELNIPFLSIRASKRIGGNLEAVRKHAQGTS